MTELHRMLRVAEDGMKGKSVPSVNQPVLAIGSGKGKKRKGPPKQNWREKVQVGSSSNVSRTKTSHIPCVANPDEANCFYCKEKGHWKRSCPKYLQDVKDGKVKPSTAGIYTISKNSPSSNSWVLDTGCGFHICSDLQGLKESREVEHGRLNLIMGNRRSSPVTKIGVYSLVLSSDVSIELFNCCYSPEMARNIISFHALFRQGFQFSFDNKIGSISVFKNGILIFTAYPCDGVYETVECVDNLGHSVNYIDSTSGVEKACLWHSRLGHISKKRIAQLQKDGVLESFDLRSDDVCETCLLGKMTKSPFKGSFERGEGLLDIIHTDVCGPFRSTTKDGTRFYVTFTDDFSRYGYIYLIKHKSDTFEKFKEFKNEVENQLGKKIKMLRSDRGGEYLSIEFLDYLKECGIVSQLTPPRTPQLNGVAERRNRTLLDRPSEDVVFVARRAVFRERELIFKEDSGSTIDLEEIQESSDDATLGETSNQHEEEVHQRERILGTISASLEGIEARNWNQGLELVIPKLIKCINRGWTGDLCRCQARCAQTPGGVHPGAVETGLGDENDDLKLWYMVRPFGYDIGLLNPAGYHVIHDTDRGQDRVRDFEVGLIDAVSSSPALKETWNWEHFALVCCVGRKWFQRGTIDHFLMKYSHAKCRVTGDEPRKERRNEWSKRTSAIADSKNVQDIEHLESSLPRIYGTIFPMNLKLMTTCKSEAMELMNWISARLARRAYDQAGLESRSCYLGSVLIGPCKDGRVVKQLEEIVFELGSHMAECVIVWSPILIEKKKCKLMCMYIDYRESDILETRLNMKYICTRYWSYFTELSDL
ncbi:hypothetical protein L2E82_31980 [Cichorium intybus]|uniref:Uncharacterized protein n=1 Tax=Cichorium intybus TaxID=13427 RepID=A0ACB9BFJ9_CICIN|nr:hypothetical protein L2E82_31980 [Cichorium intybus]